VTIPLFLAEHSEPFDKLSIITFSHIVIYYFSVSLLVKPSGGGPALTVESAGNIQLKGEENISVYSSSD